MLNFQRIELSASLKRLLILLFLEDEQAVKKGMVAKMTCQAPQSQLELLRYLGLVKCKMETIPLGEVYSYSLTIRGRQHACQLSSQ